MSELINEKSVLGVSGKCAGNAGGCLQSARERLVEAFLKVVGSAELSANTCKTAREDVLR